MAEKRRAVDFKLAVHNMATIDLTRDSDDDGERRESTFDSDAALARKVSAELNGPTPTTQKRAHIDLTADSQESAAPPAQRARTDAVSIKDMKETIKSAGLRTADLIDRPQTEARFAEALARLAERARRDVAVAPARRVSLATAPGSSRQLFFLLQRSGGRLIASWADGEAVAPRRGFTRDRQGHRVVKLRTHLKAPHTPATVHMAYWIDDADGAVGDQYQRSPMAYRQSGCRFANGATMMKSQFQKAVRRREQDIAAKAFRELLTFPKSGGLFKALRRLLVVSCEDSAPLDGINSVLDWFFAAQDYAPTEADIAFILGAAAAVAHSPEGPTKKEIPGFDWKKAQVGEKKEFLADVPLAVSAGSRRALDFLFAVASGGIDGWDGELLLAAAAHFAAKDCPPAAYFVLRPQASLGRLKPEECILAAVDSEVGAFGKPRALIFDVMEEVEPAMKRVKLDGEGGLMKWMGITRTFVRARKSYTPKDDHPDWTRVADEAARRIIAAAVVSKPPWVPSPRPPEGATWSQGYTGSRPQPPPE